MTDQNGAWHLSRSVPITLILALMVQAGAIVWWGGGIDRRVSDTERRLERQEQSITKLRDGTVETAKHLASMDATLRGMAETIRDMSRRLEARERDK